MCDITPAAERSLPPEDGAPRIARRFLRSQTCSHIEPVLDDAELLVSEIVTNAVSYAGPPISIRVECSADRLVVSVHDGAATLHPPARGASDPNELLMEGEIDLDENGRGLGFVQLLADRMDISPDATGKTVTFEMALAS